MTFTLLALILAAEPVTAPPLVTAESTVQRVSPPARLKYVGVVPEGYHLVESANSAPISIGVALLAVAYVPWAIIGTTRGNAENAIPIFGPMIAYRPETGWFSLITNTLALTAITLDVAAQVAGAITLIVGIATPRRSLERDTTPSISLVPSPGGASVVGRF